MTRPMIGDFVVYAVDAPEDREMVLAAIPKQTEDSYVYQVWITDATEVVPVPTTRKGLTLVAPALFELGTFKEWPPKNAGFTVFRDGKEL